MLDIMFRNMKKCIQPSTRGDLECKLGRYHYTDARQENKLRMNEISYIEILIEKDKILDYKRLNKVLNILENGSDVEYQNFWLDQLRETKKVSCYFG